MDRHATRDAARAEAEAILAELRAATARFGELAAIHSACISRAAGGRLGQIGPGDTVPEFEAPLRGLPEGGIAPEPVETRYGFHLLRLDARAEGAVLPFEAVAPRLRAATEKAAWVHAARDFTRGLLAGARIGRARSGRGGTLRPMVGRCLRVVKSMAWRLIVIICR